VWPILYTSIGVASYFIYKEGGGFKGAAKLPLTLYAVNLVLNGSWTPSPDKRIDTKLHPLILA
ncbi:translocator protein-like isoform X2, partial [Dinothrombium tinctorium]